MLKLNKNKVKFFDNRRRAIVILRQNLVSKIFEHDSNNIFKQSKDLLGFLHSRSSSYKKQGGNFAR